jgi:TolB-like protein
MSDHGPVLAVLPFQAAGDEREGVLAQGLVEDVCGELSRFPTLQVISWMSGLAVAHVPDTEIDARLGATHVLRGRVHRAGEQLRVTADLIECARGTHLWSESFEAPAGDVFGVQDEMVARIAATLAARLEETALKATQRKRTESLVAYELALRGLKLLRQGTPQADDEARGLFQRALELDPHYARAQAGLSLSWFNEWSCQFWDRFGENGRLAYEHAHRALDLDDSDPMVHVVIGRVLLYRREFEQASWYFDRALALCPNDAENLIQLAVCEAYLGRPEIGIERGEKAMRLNPYHPNYYYCYAALPHFVARDFVKALEVGSKAMGVPIIDIPAYTAIALAHLGRIDEAAEHFAAFNQEFRKRITFGREPEPDEACRWLLEVNPFRREEDMEFLAESARRLDEKGTPRVPAGRGKPDVGPESRREQTAMLLRHGEGWAAEYAGSHAVFPDLKGIRDIRRLLERPGEPIHCLDLTERWDAAFPSDVVLDDKARQSVKARIRDLEEELAEAQDMHDVGRVEQARAELHELVEMLSKALGLGGRSRRLGNITERARTTVTWRIRHAVRKMEALHGPLGRHLANSLRTGTFCSYQPERPVSWRLKI